MNRDASSEFKRQVDSSVASLVESYRIILKKAHIGTVFQSHDELLIAAAVENIILRNHALLDQVNELREHILLVDDSQHGTKAYERE